MDAAVAVQAAAVLVRIAYSSRKKQIRNKGVDMKLTDLSAETHGIVKKLTGDERFLKRITSIGMTEKAPFEVVKNDRKMPILIYVRETLLALNRKDGEKIEVEVQA